MIKTGRRSALGRPPIISRQSGINAHGPSFVTMSTLRRTCAILTAVGLLLSVLVGTAQSQQPPPTGPDTGANTPANPATPAIPPAQRDSVLGPQWRTSGDRVVVTSGDAAGFHVFVGDARDGYALHEVTALSEPGFDTDQWIGNVCLTASGRRAVVVYAPRGFANRATLARRGGFVAVVDIETASVAKLPVQSSLAYFSPSCGPSERVVITQEGDEDLGRTRLLPLAADADLPAIVGRRIEVKGQLTSAVPDAQGIVAADDGAVVRVSDNGSRTVIATTRGVPFDLAADRDGGVVYAERDGTERALVRRVVPHLGRGVTTPSTLASTPLTAVAIRAGRGGRVFITGEATSLSQPPPSVSLLPGPVGTQPSTDGGLAITSTESAPLAADLPATSGTRVAVNVTVPSTGRTVSLSAVPEAATETGNAPDGGTQATNGLSTGRAASPALRPAAAAVAAGVPNDPADPADRTCAVPRNDPRNQAMQPLPRQVEWAVDQAVTGTLTVARPANWKNLGMPAYAPQSLFPPVVLSGGGRVPAQVALGVAMQESNLWEAARFALPGVTANPLIGNYYGLSLFDANSANDWDINWTAADCGYGVMQLTDGMRLAGKQRPGETPLPFQTQRAVALDFAANIAAGLQILQNKWNDTRGAGLVVHNGDPSRIENWFFAVWAYNSGFNALSAAPSNSGAWGVGWLNNPANPRYPPNRLSFLDASATDAAHPQDWPYPEKVMGFAAHPPSLLDAPHSFVPAFRAAFWNGDATTSVNNRTNVKPPVNQFCDASNSCQPGTSNLPNAPEVLGEKAGPCAHRNAAGQFDLKCWYHQPTSWKSDCAFSCGNELLRFDPGFVYQDDATNYSPNCTLGGLPAGALVVDDVANDVPSVRPTCGHPWTNAGTFTLNFRPDANGTYPGKIDTHQIGGGFGGHFWFTHTRTPADTGGRLSVLGDWKLSTTRNGPMRVMVALPDHGAETHLAVYTVITAQGARTRVVPQLGAANRWVSLGAFMFNGVPEVQLSSATHNGDGSEDIAFDAVAFVPILGTPHEESVEADAVFDENQNTDTSSPESWLGGNLASRQALYDWGLNSSNSILRLPNCGTQLGECVTPTVRSAVQSWHDQVVAAGIDPVNHPVGNSVAGWIGFANRVQDRPTGVGRPAQFDDDLAYKIRVKATVSFFTAPDGSIVPGSEWTTYDHRTGNTHLPQFFRDLLVAIGRDYAGSGITLPDLTYSARNLNVHDGGLSTANPTVDGILPGRAYAYAGKAPVLTDDAGVVTTVGARCVAALTTGGGSIGYRPMLSQSGPVNAMAAFDDRLNRTANVARSVATLVADVRKMFFSTGPFVGVQSSLFNAAPPIWHELDFRACADGTIRPVSGRPIFASSWMPDGYLYHNGLAMTLGGSVGAAPARVVLGDFMRFSQTDVLHSDSGYGQCSSTLPPGRNGNPWNIPALPDPAIDPAQARFCVDATIPLDPSHSS
jgi:hypothetical protein